MANSKELNAPLYPRKNFSSESQTLSSYSKSFDYVMDLKFGETLTIKNNIKLYYNGEVDFHGPQAKFAIEAPQEICIMRLELFARYNQEYDQILQLDLGEKVVIADKNFVFVALQVVRGLVKFGLYSNEALEIKKSFFNNMQR